MQMEQKQAERNERRCERLGGEPRACFICGENDPRCLQEDHVFGRKNSDVTGTLCLNHHAKVTDHVNDHPEISIQHDRSSGEVLADMLNNIADRIEEFARWLVQVLRDFAAYFRENLAGLTLTPPPYSLYTKPYPAGGDQ